MVVFQFTGMVLVHVSDAEVASVLEISCKFDYKCISKKLQDKPQQRTHRKDTFEVADLGVMTRNCWL